MCRQWLKQFEVATLNEAFTSSSTGSGACSCCKIKPISQDYTLHQLQQKAKSLISTSLFFIVLTSFYSALGFELLSSVPCTCKETLKWANTRITWVFLCFFCSNSIQYKTHAYKLWTSNKQLKITSGTSVSPKCETGSQNCKCKGATNIHKQKRGHGKDRKNI